MPQGKIQYSYFCVYFIFVFIILLYIIDFKLGIYETWPMMYRVDTSVLNNGQLIRENMFNNYIHGYTNNNIIKPIIML